MKRPRSRHRNIRDHAKELAEDGLNKLAAALESGKSEALVNYLAVMARFHRYSWNNCLLIALQRPGASHVAGFHSWRKLGRYVRKGAKGIAILLPWSARSGHKTPSSEDEQTRVFGFRTAYVFDVADTEGADLPAVRHGFGRSARLHGTTQRIHRRQRHHARILRPDSTRKRTVARRKHRTVAGDVSRRDAQRVGS